MSGLESLVRFATACSVISAWWSVTVTATASGSQNETGTVQSSVSPLYIGAFFPFQHSSTLKFQPVVAQTALDHINSLPGILDGYRLEMRWNWTGNDSPQGALRILYNLVFYGPPVVAAFGPSLPSEAAIVNQVAARFNIVQVGLASGGKLSDRSIYPYTVRAFHVTKEVHNARAAFFKKMGWKRIAFIYEDSLSFREYMTTLQSVLEANDVQVLLSEGVQDFSNLDIHLQNLKRQDARIIFVGFYKFVTLKLFCEVNISP
ncbi:gamma-aminobutyric acid type B receptor subunit 1-like [Asterias rubens]|uniref:gamma-aminobutyric acid type B receptor subunit 1-like n=1 Tax=Asterias rubens TaxID=7604 RepID=UPI0014552B5B|nr:gamma-aminobutyric acid type B receptor subunit 1-like [Asterias rubens]